MTEASKGFPHMNRLLLAATLLASGALSSVSYARLSASWRF
jgi:hypothetical protein